MHELRYAVPIALMLILAGGFVAEIWALLDREENQ